MHHFSLLASLEGGLSVYCALPPLQTASMWPISCHFSPPSSLPCSSTLFFFTRPFPPFILSATHPHSFILPKWHHGIPCLSSRSTCSLRAVTVAERTSSQREKTVTTAVCSPSLIPVLHYAFQYSSTAFNPIFPVMNGPSSNVVSIQVSKFARTAVATRLGCLSSDTLSKSL